MQFLLIVIKQKILGTIVECLEINNTEDCTFFDHKRNNKI